MFNALFFLVAIRLVLSENATNNSGKTYYFRIGRNNEYRVHNRIFYLNHNITDSVNPHAKVSRTKESLKPEEKPSVLNYSSSHVLDEEWNYNYRNVMRTDLPLFIRNFYEQSLKSPQEKSTKRILFNENKNNSNNIMYFSMESIQPGEKILDADFYFYWPLDNTSSIFRESIVLRLYQLEKHNDGARSQSGQAENPDIHKLFSVIYVAKAHRGWQTFKVKKPLDNWLGGEENMGLLLTISYYDNNTLIEVFNDINNGNLSTFIIAKVQINSTLNAQVNFPRQTMPSGVRQCHKQEWTIDFRSLGWDEFIIAPEFFNAFDCTGRCERVLDVESNHAKLVHTLKKRSTCCVPVEYRDLIIMYYDRYGNVAIKSYKDIVTTQCGCK